MVSWKESERCFLGYYIGVRLEEQVRTKETLGIIAEPDKA